MRKKSEAESSLVLAEAGDDVSITALGMVSALGRDVIASCAAARAGLCMSSELRMLSFEADDLFGQETIDGPASLFGHVVRGVAEGFTGLARALLLGKAALQDLAARRATLDDEQARTALCVNLSDRFVESRDHLSRADAGGGSSPAAVWQERTRDFAVRLAVSAGLPRLRHHRTIHGGPAGVVQTIREAVSLLQSREVDQCIVGAVDSRTDAPFLLAAARQRLLRTNARPVGSIPGECAAFFLLERLRPQRAAERGSAPSLVSAAWSREPTDLLSDQPAGGGALAAAMRAAAAPLVASGAPIGLILSDISGTERRSMEWGCALAKLRASLYVGEGAVWFPVASFGDVGAAVGAAAVCMTIRAFERGYAPGPTALICLSSESGDKAALAVRSASHLPRGGA